MRRSPRAIFPPILLRRDWDSLHKSRSLWRPRGCFPEGGRRASAGRNSGGSHCTTQGRERGRVSPQAASSRGFRYTPQGENRGGIFFAAKVERGVRMTGGGGRGRLNGPPLFSGLILPCAGSRDVPAHTCPTFFFRGAAA